MGDVNQNVIFRIGSKLGPGGFSSLQSGIQLLSQMSGKIIEVAKEAEKFAQVHSKLTTDISKADAATKGMIDTMALMRNANILTGSGLQVTSDQFEAINKLAVKYAQATGTDATEASNRLTNALAKGSTEAFRDFGIDVRNATSMIELQTKALDGIVEKAEDTTIQIETFSEAAFALNNNLSTSVGLIWEAVSANEGLSGSLNSVNESWSEFNLLIEFAPEDLADFIFSLDGATFALKGLWNTFLEIPSWTEVFNIPVLEDVSNWFRDVQEIDVSNEQTKLDLLIEQAKQRQKSIQQERDLVATQKQVIRNMASVMGLGTEEGAASIFEEGAKAAPSAAAIGRRATGGRGGGGGREMEFSIEDVEKFESEEIDDITSRPEVHADVGVSDLFPDRPQIVDETQLALEREEIEIAQERLDLRNEEQENQREFVAEMTDHAGAFGDAWMSAYDSVSAGALAAQGAQQMFKAAIGATVKAAIKGGAGIKETMRAVVEEVGTALSIEATWRGLMELANGVADAARPFGTGAAEASAHFVAAGMYFAVAAATGVAAAVAARNAPKSGGNAATSAASPSSVATSAMDTSSQEAWKPGDDSRKDQTVYISLSYDDEGILTAVKKQNDSASMNGEQHFATVAS